MFRTATKVVGRILRRSRRDTRGSAAIEFAMLMPAFLTLLFAMFEIGITYFAGAIVQDAVDGAARRIRTGQTQLAAVTVSQFRDQVCDSLDVMLTCDRLEIDVRVVPSFGGNDMRARPSSMLFQPGNPCEVVLVRAFYGWNILTPWLGDALDLKMDGDGGDHYMQSADMPEGQFMIRGAAAIRNEPFGNAPCP